jgi:hypothetical protein
MYGKVLLITFALHFCSIEMIQYIRKHAVKISQNYNWPFSSFHFFRFYEFDSHMEMVI